jgi:two-component system CheB/CheR fusion protein
MAREGLRQKLTIALHKASAHKETAHHPNLRVKTNGDFTDVHLTVQPVAAPPAAQGSSALFLVILEKAPEPEKDQEPAVKTVLMDGVEGGVEKGTATEVDAHIAELRRELQTKEEYLQSANEELETSNEELKSANEEMQSVNEELQSTNEEMETSKEELQSVNEELATVNNELQQKVADLSRTNNDMNNLLAGTGIGTIFVDHQLRILRFTPDVSRVINLILTDVGRPVGHILSNLNGYDRLTEDVQAVLNTLTPKEIDVQTRSGAWYSLRIRPYRTLENVIEGAVITFVDISEIKRVREALQESEKKFRELYENSTKPSGG